MDQSKITHMLETYQRGGADAGRRRRRNKEGREAMVGPTCKRPRWPAPPPADVDKWTRVSPLYAFIHRKRVFLFFGSELFSSLRNVFPEKTCSVFQVRAYL